MVCSADRLADSCGEELSVLSQLTRIDFANSRWVTAAMADRLAVLPHLKRLNLSSCMHMTSRSLQALSQLTGREDLNLCENEVI